MPWLCIKYLLSSSFARHTATVDHPFPNPIKYSFKISKELITFENCCFRRREIRGKPLKFLYSYNVHRDLKESVMSMFC